MASLQPFYNWTKELSEEDIKHPVLFIGHGSPMNGIEDNEFSQTWAKMGETIQKPKAVLVISAHWLTRGTHITAMENPKTIHDFGGSLKNYSTFNIQQREIQNWHKLQKT